ncbi:hypothetical protein C1T17_13775 [Sphingobium sp. SCG-1]|uniref:hypothetical protein n=1 Tax=Sphingobium sp. SCG-1 TaxID=2072936 RepID=UPI000CD677F0|nr:hypothetical protein [Sphingobium sp. SCG-1]AUW59002.1 hypothetical protein C1T17_13775 [Sphingobium sp. SCG-1]
MTSIEATARIAGTIERALNVLREAAGAKDKVQTRGVALALWVLRGYCPAEWLVAFWDAAGSDHAIGRSQGLHAAYNGIVRQVRTSGGLSKGRCDDRLSR